MPKLHALHRYPVKGFSPDVLAEVRVEPGHGLPYDRVWAIENGPGAFDTEAPAHVSKKNFLMLAGQDRLAALRTQFSEPDAHWSMTFPDGQTRTLDLDVPATHTPLLDALAGWLGADARGALRLVKLASGLTDIRDPYPSLINLASVRDLSERVGTELDAVRFRGNILVDGLPPWAELDMVGKTLTVGEVRLKVQARIRRCRATGVNPASGDSDQDLTRALFEAFGHMDCGVYLSVEQGGMLRPGLPLTDL